MLLMGLEIVELTEWLLAAITDKLLLVMHPSNVNSQARIVMENMPTYFTWESSTSVKLLMACHSSPWSKCTTTESAVQPSSVAICVMPICWSWAATWENKCTRECGMQPSCHELPEKGQFARSATHLSHFDMVMFSPWCHNYATLRMRNITDSSHLSGELLWILILEGHLLVAVITMLAGQCWPPFRLQGIHSHAQYTMCFM